MKVCYFGIYNPNHPPNRILIKGLRKNDIEVIQCRVDPTKRFKYWNLFKKHLQVKNYDVMIVGFPGHPVMPLARLICRKKIVLDAHLSLYELSLARGVYFSHNLKILNLKALKNWLLDYISCRLADKIILDTEEHIKYFVKTFGLNRNKSKRIFMGCDNDLFYPREHKKRTDKFLVNFHGSYILSHGIEYILEAAKILENENVEFNLIGNGQVYQKMVNLSKELNTKNVNFIDFLPYEELVKYISQADVCLGLFGKAPKIKRVIATKVYEAIAMRKPVITGEVPAMKELFQNRKHCLFCNIGDSHDLAEKILELKNNPELRERIAGEGYKLFKARLIPKVLGQELKGILESL